MPGLLRVRTTLLSVVVLLMVFCSRDVLFDPQRVESVTVHTFVSDTTEAAFELGDTLTVLQSIGTAQTGDTMSFVGIVVPEDAPVEATWDFGDGQKGTGAITTHAYARSGTYTAVLTLTDRAGYTLEDSVTVIVSRLSSVTVVSPTDGQRDVNPASPEGIRFAWSPGTDGETGTADLYLGTSPKLDQPVLAGIADTSIQYRASLQEGATYYWRVVVRDSEGETDTSAIFQFQTSRPTGSADTLTVALAPDTAIPVGGTVHFRVVASGYAFDSVLLRWDLSGDGTWEDRLVSADGTAQLAHTYGTEGVYEAVVKAVDPASGLHAVDTSRVVVTEEGPPVIVSIRTDTSVTVGDSVPFFGAAQDLGGSIAEYAWDFDGNGNYDYTDKSSAAGGHRYTGAGSFDAVLRVTDNTGNTAFDTVHVEVAAYGNLEFVHLSDDTTIDHGGTVICSVAVSGGAEPVRIEIDITASGNYQAIGDSTRTAGYRFSPPADYWDNVKVRVTDGAGDSIHASFAVDIRPRKLRILRIDSTETTVTVNYTASPDSDFAEYRIYRNTTNNVDMNSELWATITKQTTVSFSSPQPGYADRPHYYRVYQIDKEKQWSSGSNVVYGNIKNSPVSEPTIVYPKDNGAVLWADQSVRWRSSEDPNVETVTYAVAVAPAGESYTTLATELTDTVYALAKYAKVGFAGRIRVTATGDPGDKRSSTRGNIKIRPVVKGAMRIVRAGTFTDAEGRRATISHHYWLDTVEVEQTLYRQLVAGRPPSHFRGENRPVDNITWYEALSFCNARSKAEGLDTVYTYTYSQQNGVQNLVCHWERVGYRLPTEDEWELAARAGVQLEYPTADGSISCELANYQPCGKNGTVVTAEYAPTPAGFYDLAGNVAEWCWDIYSPFGRPADRTDYTGTGSTGFWQNRRVVRGGSYATGEQQLQSGSSGMARADRGESNTFGFIGLRCVLPFQE